MFPDVWGMVKQAQQLHREAMLGAYYEPSRSRKIKNRKKRKCRK